VDEIGLSRVFMAASISCSTMSRGNLAGGRIGNFVSAGSASERCPSIGGPERFDRGILVVLVQGHVGARCRLQASNDLVS
jgi:hypothetical protein